MRKALYFSSTFLDCERSEIWREKAAKILHECLETIFMKMVATLKDLFLSVDNL